MGALERRQEVDRRDAIAPANAYGVEVIYVAEPGYGPRDPRPPEGVTPVLHVSYWINSQRQFRLVDIAYLEAKGLPTAYDMLVEMFPALRWSAR